MLFREVNDLFLDPRSIRTLAPKSQEKPDKTAGNGVSKASMLQGFDFTRSLRGKPFTFDLRQPVSHPLGIKNGARPRALPHFLLTKAACALLAAQVHGETGELALKVHELGAAVGQQYARLLVDLESALGKPLSAASMSLTQSQCGPWRHDRSAS